MHIHALAATSRGAPLEPYSYKAPKLGAHQILVRALACGVCRSDLHMIDNDWGFSSYPLVPGHELVGEVVEVGEEVRHLRAGQRVGVGWQASSCMHCHECLTGRENMCDRQEVLVALHGGFADHVVVDGRFAFAIPDGISTREAGPLLCGGVTVLSALRAAGMGSGLSIGVIGVGGLGHLAIQIASKLGNRVTAFTGSHDKAEEAGRFGATEAVIVAPGASPPAPKRRLDILLNTAPTKLDWAGYLEHVGSDGALVLVAAEPTVSLPFAPLMAKRRRVLGSAIGGRASILEALRIADEYGVRPQIEVFPAQAANAALARVRSNQVRYRAVLDLAGFGAEA